MKGIAITYPAFAIIVICYWLFWFAPFPQNIFGSDGILFFATGFFILGITALQTILWAVPIIRNGTISIIGKRLSFISITAIALFFCWGSYMIASMFIYGI